MKTLKSRRDFVRSGLLIGASVPLLSLPFLSCNSNPKKESAKLAEPKKKLNILILGGTSFLGPHQISYALDRGHSVTTFTRGKTIPKIHTELFSKVEQLIGDRENDLEALKNRTWDAVIDNSGHKVEWTKATAELLKDQVGTYMYTSSTGVYYPYHEPNIREDRELVLEMPEKFNFEYDKGLYEYGIMKANSELAAQNVFGSDRTVVVRPTYMIGPGDRTDRSVYWPVRMNMDGEAIVPGKYNDAVQYVDIRDIAYWMIRLLENETTGVFNGVGPENKTTVHEFVKEVHAAFDSKSTLIMIDDYKFLDEHGVFFVVPWILPTDQHKSSAYANNELSKKNGLTFENLKKTVTDINDWWNSEALSERREVFMKSEFNLMNREEEILEAWKKLKTQE